MMKKDFDFKDIGKQMPYRVPEGFFAQVQEEVMERAEEGKRKKSHRIKLIVLATLMAAAVLWGVIFFSVPQSGTEPLPSGSLIVSTEWDDSYSAALDCYIESMPDAELAEWVELSENDIFIN